MHRRIRLISPALVTLLLLAACSATPSSSDGGGASQEPGASTGGAASQEPAASQGGGGGGGIDVTLSDGTWTGGSAQVTVSGDASANIDAQLQSMLSTTSGASTTLTYVSSSSELVAIAIYTDSFAVSVTTADMTGGGGTTTTCDVTWHSTDDNNLSADFNCPNSPAFTTSGTSGGTIDIEGSFTATR